MKKVILSCIAIVGLIVLAYVFFPSSEKQPARIGVLSVSENLEWEKIQELRSDAEVGKLIHKNSILSYTYAKRVPEPGATYKLLGEFPVPDTNEYIARVYGAGNNIALVVKIDAVSEFVNVLPSFLYAEGKCETLACRQVVLDLAKNIKQL